MERVLVVPAARVAAVGQGFAPATPEMVRLVLDPAAYEFRPRGEVEADPAWKQLIPYVVLRHGDHVFRYRRGAAGSEGRLHAKWSVGIGGHINDSDSADDPYHAGMIRELREEVRINSDWAGVLAGFVNDDSNPVGRVHLGVVHVVDVCEMDVTVGEDALLDGEFEDLSSLLGRIGEFETWSRLVLEHLGSA